MGRKQPEDGTDQNCDCDTGRMQSTSTEEWNRIGGKVKILDRCILSLLSDLNSVPKSWWKDEFDKANDGMSGLRCELENRMFEEHVCDEVGTGVFYGTGGIEEAVIRLDSEGVHVVNVNYDDRKTSFHRNSRENDKEVNSMPEFICPTCGGGFPEDSMRDGVACPWCHQMLDDLDLADRKIAEESDR